MANTRIIKRRIKSATNISQITRAMEMVAASKMRRAQLQALAARPYSHSLRNILFSLLQSTSTLKHSLITPNDSQKVAVLVISTDKGLCGGLNTNLFRSIKAFAEKIGQANLVFLNIGKKSRSFLTKSNFEIAADFTEIPEKLSFEDSLQVSHFLTNAYQLGQIGKAYISFSNFISTLSQKPKIIRLLPLNIEDIQDELGLLDKLTKESFSSLEYLLEPSPKQIARTLLPYFIELVIYHYILESRAAEHSARMVAMRNASQNASEIVDELTLSYNNARQAAITAQIAEVSSAQMAIGK